MLWLPKLFGKRCVATIHGLDHQRAKWGKIVNISPMANREDNLQEIVDGLQELKDALVEVLDQYEEEGAIGMDISLYLVRK